MNKNDNKGEFIYVWNEEQQLFFWINKEKYIEFINKDKQFLNKINKKIIQIFFFFLFIQLKPVYAITLKLKNSEQINIQNNIISENLYNQVKPLVIKINSQKYNNEHIFSEKENFLMFLNFLNQNINNEQFLIKSFKKEKIKLIKKETFLKIKQLKGGFSEFNYPLNKHDRLVITETKNKIFFEKYRKTLKLIYFYLLNKFILFIRFIKKHQYKILFLIFLLTIIYNYKIFFKLINKTKKIKKSKILKSKKQKNQNTFWDKYEENIINNLKNKYKEEINKELKNKNKIDKLKSKKKLN